MGFSSSRSTANSKIFDSIVDFLESLYFLLKTSVVKDPNDCVPSN